MGCIFQSYMFTEQEICSELYFFSLGHLEGCNHSVLSQCDTVKSAWVLEGQTVQLLEVL